MEEAGFEPSVPLYILTVSDPLLVGPVTVPFAKRKSPVRDRVQAFDACFRRRVYRATAWGLSARALPGWRDLDPSAYGHAAGEVVRARAITAMVLRSRLQNHVEGVSVARLTLWKPPRLPREPVPRRLAPGAAPTSCVSEVGTQTIIEPA